MPIVAYIQKNFYLDTRSLALFRIGLGLISIQNAAITLVYANTFFGPNSLLPLAGVKKDMLWSLYALSDNPYFIASLLAANILAGLMLVLGWRTRMATIACWILQLSLAHRLLIARNGGDAVLIVLLFWGIFLPLGAWLSIDRSKDPSTPSAPMTMAGPVAMALVIQIGIIYLATVLTKTSPCWRTTYTAVYLAFSGTEFSAPLGRWLTQFPDLLKSLTIMTIILESIGASLLFIPKYQAFFRSLTISVFMIFHFSIFLTMDLGMFPWVMMAAWAALLPTGFWQWLCPRAAPARPPSSRPAFGRWQYAVLAFTVYSIVINQAPLARNATTKAWTNALGKPLLNHIGLQQEWLMFAPGAASATRTHYYTPLFSPALPPEMPEEGTAGQYRFKNADHHRFKKYLFALKDKENRRYLDFLNKYAVRCWNEEHPDGPFIKYALVLSYEHPIPLK